MSPTSAPPHPPYSEDEWPPTRYVAIKEAPASVSEPLRRSSVAHRVTAFATVVLAIAATVQAIVGYINMIERRQVDATILLRLERIENRK